MKKKKKVSDNHVIVTLGVTFAVALVVIILIFSALRSRTACPPQKQCEVCKTAECPVCECSQTPCPECPKVPECETCEECPEVNANNATTVLKYVCPDKRIVDDAVLCSVSAPSVFDPATTNENGTHIEEVEIKPSCIYGKNGASIYFKVDTIASEVDYQIKDSPEKDFETIYTVNNLYDGYRSMSFKSPEETYTKGDFSVVKGGVYLMRLEFHFGTGGVSYSNEHVIDTSPGGEYVQITCG